MKRPMTLHGMIAEIYGSLDAEDCAMVDREWAKFRGFDLPQSSRVSDLKTPPELLALIERSKNYVMSPEEIYEQRRSFARGMCPSNRDYKKWCETVDRMMPPLADTRPDRKCK